VPFHCFISQVAFH